MARPGLTHPRKAALEGLRKRGLDGSLTQKELNAFRRKGHAAGKGLNAFLAALRLLRRRGEGLAHLPPEVLGHLDAAIEILSNDRTLQMAGLRDEPPFRAISRKKIIT